MIKNIIKVIAAGVAGYIVGLVIGIIFGVLLGFVISLFFQEIVFANSTVVMSILMAIILGGGLGFSGSSIIKKIYETNDNPFIGLILGAGLGLIVIGFYGVVDMSSSNIVDKSFYRIPILYGTTLGQYIGSIFYPIICIKGVVYDIAQTYKQLKFNKENKNQLSFYRSKNFDNDK